MSDKLPKLLTIDEVAEMFRVSKATVYRIIESRLIPFYKISRAIRFAEDDVVAYLESQRIKPKSEWFFRGSAQIASPQVYALMAKKIGRTQLY